MPQPLQNSYGDLCAGDLCKIKTGNGQFKTGDKCRLLGYQGEDIWRADFNNLGNLWVDPDEDGVHNVYTFRLKLIDRVDEYGSVL